MNHIWRRSTVFIVKNFTPLSVVLIADFDFFKCLLGLHTKTCSKWKKMTLFFKCLPCKLSTGLCLLRLFWSTFHRIWASFSIEGRSRVKTTSYKPDLFKKFWGNSAIQSVPPDSFIKLFDQLWQTISGKPVNSWFKIILKEEEKLKRAIGKETFSRHENLILQIP